MLIHNMLLNADGDDLEALLDLLLSSVSEQEMETVRRDYSTDYALASTLYPFFTQTTEDVAIQEEWDRCKAETDVIMAELEHIRNDFPFTAADMLADPEKVEDYKKELEHRLFEAKKEREQLSELIRKMIERVAAYE